MKYAEFDESLRPFIAGGCCLWGRRMTLGPTPEFCLHAPAEVSVPHAALETEDRGAQQRAPWEKYGN